MVFVKRRKSAGRQGERTSEKTKYSSASVVCPVTPSTPPLVCVWYARMHLVPAVVGPAALVYGRSSGSLETRRTSRRLKLSILSLSLCCVRITGFFAGGLLLPYRTTA